MESNFQPVWWVLNALKAHDHVLTDELNEARKEMGKTKRRSRHKGGITKIIVDLPVSAGRSFSDSLTTKLVEQTTASWHFWFGLLERYVQENGTSQVPQNFQTTDNFKLGGWANNQRSNEGILSNERRDSLNALKGWVWNTVDGWWDEGFGHLKQYISDNGDALVPNLFVTSDGFKLGTWIQNQRTTKDVMTVDRQRRLESLAGWKW